ncbi:MAG: polyketide synthase, partial [Deltaproteobacteria bacterium]
MKSPSNREPIAIIGMSGIFPKALTLEEFWRNIQEGVDCIIEVPRERWDPELYYDPDFRAEDKTYCKIGGFITDFTFDGLKFRIPPAVSIRLDLSQQLALVAMQQLFEEGGFDRREFDRERTGVILGNAQGGDNRDHMAYRVYLPQMKRDLMEVPQFRSLDPAIREEILARFSENVRTHFPKITEDSMPGGLSNVIAGRLANRWNLRGPNYTCDAACASGLAALSAAVDALREGEIDLAVTGAVDTNMAPGGFIQFSKIGALSPNLSCPFDHRANGFVMGEGCGLIILKRLSDAIRDGDEIFALIRGIGGSSDGKGKGITAPNPIGQELAIQRAFEDAGYGPESVQLIEAHGTSTKVGDVVEFQSLMKIFSPHVSGHRKIGLGSVKSNIGHLKAAAGIAGLLKAVLALHHKVLPPSINFEKPNPALRIEESPFYVVTETTPWPRPGKHAPRRANVSAFGFGGTNFHIALEEYDPGLPPQGYSLKGERESASPRSEGARAREVPLAEPSPSLEAYFDTYLPLEGETFFLGGKDADEVGRQLTFLQEILERGPLFGREAPYGIRMVELAHPLRTNARNQPFRVAFSAVDPKDLTKKVKLALEAIAEPRKRHMFRVKGIFFTEGEREPGKIAFMFPGQGSQYVNMCRNLYRKYRIVHDTLVQADEILYDLIGERILDLLFVDDLSDPENVRHHEAQLTRTEVMQPVILAADVALSRLLGAFGITPDVVMGHSLGEYAAAVVAEVMSFEDALYAVSVRGREMEPVLEEVGDPGKMASVGCSTEKAEEILKGVSGYVIVANKNCNFQTVIAGESGPMAEAIERFRAQGIDARLIPVSHAFHSAIVAPAGPAYRKMLERLDIRPPKLPILCNATADYYPTGPNAREEIIELLVRHFHSPVEFIPQVERMYADGV